MSQNQNKKTDGFIVQAGILAAAGIIVRIIGILYRSPLTGIIGDEGNGYYSTAYNIYTIILLLSSYSIPSAISKVIAQRLALQEYRNAHRIFQCALIYVLVVGGCASALTWLFAGVLVDENAVSVLRVFVPTIFLSGILGVLRGYFQAHENMVFTSFSQILEQIFNAAVSILAAWFLIAASKSTETTTRAIRGAMGSAAGTGAGVLVALIFMFVLYRVNRKFFNKRISRDPTQEVLSRREIFRMILLVVTPFILSTFIYNFSTSLNQTIYIRILKGVKHYNSAEASTMYGIFAGKAVVISNIPVAIASAVSAAMIPAISGSFARGDVEETKEKVQTAIQTTMLVSIPAAVGMAVLARPIMLLLFPQKESLDTAVALLQAMSVSVVFYSLSTLTNAVLQGIGRVNRPVINALIALAAQTAVLVPALLYTELNQYCLVLAAVVYSFTMCVLNQLSVRKYLGYRQRYMKTFILPALSAAIMGAAAWGIYEGGYAVFESNVLWLCISILAAVCIYFALVLKIGALGREELQHIPGGGRIAGLAERVHLL